eukprot:868929-Amorphochlora_amoeboformis.AAC.1
MVGYAKRKNAGKGGRNMTFVITGENANGEVGSKDGEHGGSREEGYDEAKNARKLQYSGHDEFHDSHWSTR